MCKMKYGLSEMDLKIIAVSNRKLCERPFLEQIERVCQMKPQAKIPKEVKEQFQTIGTSVHSVEDAKEAEELGVSYMTAGHIYVTDCKKGLAPRGLGFLKAVCSTVSVPVYAIGGIKFDEKQWEELKQNGASGGCIMSAMMEL